MSKERQKPSKAANNQAPMYINNEINNNISSPKKEGTGNQTAVHITNNISNNISTSKEETKKTKMIGAVITIVCTIAGIIIALLELLFGDGIIKDSPKKSDSFPTSSQIQSSSNSTNTSSAKSLSSSQTTLNNLQINDGEVLIRSGQTVKIYTNEEKDIKLYYRSNEPAIADYTIIGKRGGQNGELFRNMTMNPRGGYFSLTKWEQLFMTITDGEIILSLEGEGVIKILDQPLVESKEICAGETYEVTRTGKETANLTIKGIEEDTKGEYHIFPYNNSNEENKLFELFPTDCFYEMLEPNDKIVITVTNGAIEIYGDYTHFKFN